jgi:hypothetical protein
MCWEEDILRTRVQEGLSEALHQAAKQDMLQQEDG